MAQSWFQTALDKLSLVRSKTITLTDAQIKALPTTPVEIVPSPGANRCLLPIMTLVVPSFTVAYTNIFGNTSSLQFGYHLGGASLGTITEGSAAIFSSTTPAFYGIPVGGNVDDSGLLYPIAQNLSAVADKPITIGAATNGTDFTGGSAANTLTVTVLYIIANV